MAENLLGQRLSHGHEENGPVNGVKTKNIFADQVQVGRPKLLVLLTGVIRIIANAANIVVERIHPDVHHVAGVEINRNAPGKGSTGHTQILQAGL